MGITRSSPPDVFFGKDVLKMCGKFTREHSCGSVISIKLLCNFIEITPRHLCFPVNLLHNFRTPFLKGQIWKAASGLGESVILRLWNTYIQLSVIIYLWITISQLFVIFNNIRATGALNKNRLRTCTIVGDKQSQQKKTGMWPLWTTYIKQKKQC